MLYESSETVSTVLSSCMPLTGPWGTCLLDKMSAGRSSVLLFVLLALIYSSFFSPLFPGWSSFKVWSEPVYSCPSVLQTLLIFCGDTAFHSNVIDKSIKKYTQQFWHLLLSWRSISMPTDDQSVLVVIFAALEHWGLSIGLQASQPSSGMLSIHFQLREKWFMSSKAGTKEDKYFECSDLLRIGFFFPSHHSQISLTGSPMTRG